MFYLAPITSHHPRTAHGAESLGADGSPLALALSGLQNAADARHEGASSIIGISGAVSAPGSPPSPRAPVPIRFVLEFETLHEG
jgi:hypothetical protein